MLFPMYEFDFQLLLKFSCFHSMCLQECIMKLLHGKTVIFVTHQVEFLPAADLILVRAVVIFLALVRNPFICSLYLECPF